MRQWSFSRKNASSSPQRNGAITVRQQRTELIVPLIVGCALFMEMLDSTIITTALPVMAQALHESAIQLNLAITSYLLSLAVFIPVSGWVADRFGARKVFRAAIVVFTIGSMMCGVSQSLGQLVISRIFQGLGGAMMTPVGRVVVLKTVDRSELVTAMSFLTVPSMLGPVVGPLLGGFIVTYYSWRWIFFINVPVCILGIVLVTLYIRDIHEEDVPPLDYRGFLLTGVGLFGLVFFLETVGRGMLPVWLVIAGLVIGTTCSMGYWFHAKRIPRPIIQLKLFEIPTFAAATIYGGLFRMGIGAMPFLLALLLQIGFGLTPFASGMLTFVSAVGSLTTKMTIKPIVRAFGFRQVLVINGLITALSMAIIALFRITTPHSVIVLVLLFGGFFRSLQFTCLGSLAYADIPPNLLSNASSAASMAQQLAMSLGITGAAMSLRAILAIHGVARLHARDVSPAFVIMAFLAALSPLLFLRLEHHAGHELSGHVTPASEAARRLSQETLSATE